MTIQLPGSFTCEPQAWCANDHLVLISQLDVERRCHICRGTEENDAPLIPIELPPEDAYIEVEERVTKRYHFQAEDFESPQEWAEAWRAAQNPKEFEYDFDDIVSAHDPVWEDEDGLGYDVRALVYSRKATA